MWFIYDEYIYYDIYKQFFIIFKDKNNNIILYLENKTAMLCLFLFLIVPYFFIPIAWLKKKVNCARSGYNLLPIGNT